MIDFAVLNHKKLIFTTCYINPMVNPLICINLQSRNFVIHLQTYHHIRIIATVFLLAEDTILAAHHWLPVYFKIKEVGSYI